MEYEINDKFSVSFVDRDKDEVQFVPLQWNSWINTN